MDIRAKERGDGGRTVPTTVGLATAMFWDADGMIAKDGMKIGGFIPVFLEYVPTGGADRCLLHSLTRALRARLAPRLVRDTSGLFP